MADTGIGAGLPAVDASAAARKSSRAEMQDASGGKASFGSALERARDGSERQPADARQAEHARFRNSAADDKAGGRQATHDDAHEDEGATAARRGRPALDLRMTGRAGAQGATPGQPETGETLAAGAATITVARLPKNLRPAGQGTPLESEADAAAGDTATPPHEAGDEKAVRLRKGQKAARDATGGDKADAKAVAGKTAAGGKPGSAETDALTLLQAADGTEAAPAGGKVADKAPPADVKPDIPVVALAAHTMQAKAEGGGKANDGVGHVGAGKGGTSAHGADAMEAGEAEAKADAPAGGRAFRFSRADGRGQTLDMVIGGDGKEAARDLRKTPVEAVTVVDSRRYLALSQNSNTIMNALSGDPEWTSAMQPSSALSNAATLASTGKVVNTLKIQIHPMTLGTVTATMRLAGDELSVDLAVETVAAYRQLTDDQSGMVDSLRAQGFAVDQVTVTLVQPPEKSDSTGTQANGQNPSFGQQAAQDGSASPRRDDRHAAQQNWRGGDAVGEDTQPGAAAGPGSARPGTLYL